MKKLLIALLMLLPVTLWAQTTAEPYVVLSQDSLTVTFYYDDQKASRGGIEINENNGSISPYGGVVTAVFDSSFGNYMPTITYCWFANCAKLTSITGMQFLKTDNVMDMEYMFLNCSSLTSLDLSGFNTANVTDMQFMFGGCSSLTSLDVSGFNTDNVTNMQFMFADCSGLVSLDLSGFNTANVTTMFGMFSGCSGLKSLDVSGFNTSNVTTMDGMFYGCSDLKNLDLSNFNTANVTDMYWMFCGCSGLTNLDVSDFNTSNVTNMGSMFEGCSALASLDVSGFNTANVTDMESMFSYCYMLTAIFVSEGWSTVSVIRASGMFSYCLSLIGGAGTLYDEKYTDNTYAHIDGGESNPGYLTDINSIEVVGNTNLSSEWWTAFSRNYEIPANYTLHMRFINHSAKANNWENWVMLCTADSTRLPEYFALRADRFGWGDYYNADNFTVNWADWAAFREAVDGALVDFTVRRWGREVVVNSVFKTLDGTEYIQTYTTAIDTAANRSVNVFFTVEKAYLEIYKNSITLTPSEAPPFEPYAVLSEDSLTVTFYYDDQKSVRGGMNINNNSIDLGSFSEYGTATKAIIDESFANYYPTSTACWFQACNSLAVINGIENIKTKNVTDMSGMFNRCPNLTSIDVSGFITDNVTDMGGMFNGCSSLTQLDVSGFKTDNVTRMISMFGSCSGLTSLDISGFKTENVDYMTWMFFSCSNLKTIYVGEGWNTTNVTQSFSMFENCTSLVGGAGTTYDGAHTDYTYAHIDGGESNPGYFTDINAPAWVEKPSAPEFAFEGDNLVMTSQTEGASIFYAMADLPSTDDEAVVDSVTNSFTVKVGADDGNFYYEQPFELKKSVVLKAIAVGNGTDGQEAVSDTTVLVYDYEAWDVLIHTVYQAQEIYRRAEGNSKVDQTLVEELKWMIDECTMMYFQRAMMPYFEAKHFTARLVELMGEILGQMESQDNIIQFADARAKAICVANWDADSDGELSYDEAAAVQSIGEAFAQSKVATFNEFQYFKNVRQLSRNTFYMCDSLREVTLPDSLIAIGAYAFAKSPLLSTVSIPQTVMTIEESAFEGCTGLTSIVLPDSLAELGGWAIGDCTSLTSVVIPKKITSLSRRLLYRNTALTSVTLPETLLSIGESAFEGCTSLTAIDIPESVTEIGPNAFTSSGLTTVTIPANVTSIQERAFAGIESLTTVTSKIISPFEIRSNVFSEATYQNAVLYVPEGTVNAYRNTSSWNLFMRIRAEGSQGDPEPYAVLSENNTVLTFYYDDQKEARGGMSVGPFDIPQSRGWYEAKDYITSVVFDDSFADCTTITSTRYWFDQCFNLASISGLQFLNTSNVTDMDGMFWECSSLGALDLSNFKTSNVTSMNEMFASCKSLTTLDVSNFDTSNVKYMNGMFTNCSGLTTLDLSNFVTSNVLVMPAMFADCSSLTKVDLSSFNTANVWNMESMFNRCSALTTIYVGADWTTAAVTQSSNNMFSGCFNLVGGAGTVYDANHTDHTYAHIDGGAANPGYFTDINAPQIDYAFDNNGVLTVNSNATMTEVLKEAAVKHNVPKWITAIVWNSSKPIDNVELQELTNPNMLIYVAADTLAPKNRDNVVVNGVAKNIVLTDAATGNNNFYVPQQFTAESISYTRNFQQQTQVGVSRGWESIALPFDVQSVKHEKQGDIAPFGSTESGKHFWLRRLTPDGLQRATRIEANVPYVLSMPNNEEYSAEYNLGGRVTFSAQNATVPVTAAKVTALADSSITMVPTTVAVGRSSSVWALNVGQVRGSYLEGSVFERDYREVRPFEAYTVHRQGSSDDDNPSPRMIPVQKLMGSDATGIEEVRVERSEVSSDRWYDLNGRRLQARPTAKGVYIKDGRKVVIK